MTQKVALITGASRGLGAALAEALALSGWHVLAVARTVGGLEELDDRVKAQGGAGGITLAPMDVTNEDAMEHLCSASQARWGGFGFWAHTAIYAAPLSPADSVDAKELEKSYAVNIRAVCGLIAKLTPLLRAQSGSAMFFDDPLCGARFSGAYGISKAGQIAQVRSWQHESTRIGPRVLIETPAPMPTAVRARFYPGEIREVLTPPKAEAERLLAKL